MTRTHSVVRILDNGAKRGIATETPGRLDEDVRGRLSVLDFVAARYGIEVLQHVKTLQARQRANAGGRGGNGEREPCGFKGLENLDGTRLELEIGLNKLQEQLNVQIEHAIRQIGVATQILGQHRAA
ncbi:Uncharacterised protein [Collinsella intestinalis]|nr:Uncharacterised protein [Collinsella intestinalis]